jgi:hypothetical protein
LSRLPRLLLVLLVAWSAPKSAFAGSESTRTGAHFRIVGHFDNDALASAALETAEATWSIAVELWGERAPERIEPLSIHLYRTIPEFEAAEEKRTAGWFKETLSYSDHATRTAHIVVQPECSDARFKALGLPGLTRELVAHEAAHLASYVLWSKSYRSHPSWFAEGFAIWVGATALAKHGWSRGFEEDPYLARGLVVARELASRGELPRFDHILRDDLGELDRFQRYGVWQAAFQFLRTGRLAVRFQDLIAASRELPGGPDFTRELEREAIRVLGERSGSGGFGDLDHDFVAWVLARTPRWDEVLRALDTSGDAWVQQAFAAEPAVAWRTEPVLLSTYSASGEFELLPGGEQELRFLLGRRPRGFVAVGFRAGFGVTVSAYEEEPSGTGRFQLLARARTPALVTGRRLPFRIDVEPGRLRVTIDRQPVLEAELGDRPVHGPWGLGAEKGSAGTWRRIAVGR